MWALPNYDVETKTNTNNIYRKFSFFGELQNRIWNPTKIASWSRNVYAQMILISSLKIIQINRDVIN